MYIHVLVFCVCKKTCAAFFNTVVHLIYSNFHYNLHYSEYTFYSTAVLLLLFSNFSFDMYHVRYSDPVTGLVWPRGWVEV